MLNGPDEAIEFLRNLTDESLMEALVSGLKFDQMIDVQLKADHKVNFSSTLLNIAARYNFTQSIQVLLNNGANINQIDANGFNALDFSSSAFDNDATVLLLIKGCHVNDSQILVNLLNMDDAIERLIMFLIYSEKPVNLLKSAKEKNNSQINMIIDRCCSDSNNCFKVVSNYFFMKTPKWSSEFNQFTTMFERIEYLMEEIDNIKRHDAQSLKQSISNLIDKINRLSKHLSDVNMMFSEKKQRFVDYLPFCEKSVLKISEAFQIIEDPSLMHKYAMKCEIDPYIHCAIYCIKYNNIDQCKQFLFNQLSQIERSITSIPKFDDILKEMKEKFIEIGQIFSATTRLHINNLRNHLDEFIPEIIFNQTLGNFIEFQISGNITKTEQFKFDTTDIDIAIANLRVAVLRSQWKFSKAKNDESSKANNYHKLTEYANLCENCQQLKKQLQDFESFPTNCPYCRNHVASYICPCCNALICCNNCKDSINTCKYCNCSIKDAIKINKTCYFGLDGNKM